MSLWRTMRRPYMLLQKLRAGMVNPERGLIGGVGKTVEMDEAFISGGRAAEGHKDYLQPLLAAVEVKGQTAGRLRMQISTATRTRKQILAFLRFYGRRGNVGDD